MIQKPTKIEQRDQLDNKIHSKIEPFHAMVGHFRQKNIFICKTANLSQLMFKPSPIKNQFNLSSGCNYKHMSLSM